MNKFLSIILSIAMVACLGLGACAEQVADAEAPSMVEALLVTEVMDWGETLTAIRIEYSEEIACDAYDFTAMAFTIKSTRHIVYTYVNNSGKLDDVQPYGKYLFLKLDILTADGGQYLDQVAFSESGSIRPLLDTIYVYQNVDIQTLSGNIIPPGNIRAQDGIRMVVDDFQSVYYTTVDGIDFYYNIYIPSGYEAKDASLADLPLVVHYPSGDYACVDYNGVYNGSLYRHPDCTVWAEEDVQARHPAFVVTIGASSRIADTMTGTFDEIWASAVYVEVVKMLIDTYNIDPSRVYAVSLAGGTTMMWNTIMRYPDLYAASMSTSFDFYMSYVDPDLSLTNMKLVLDAVPAWFFCGMQDPTGSDPFDLGRLKGERLRDIAYLVNEDGYHVDVAFGENGELMWNGMLRGAEAAAVAQAQIDRAAANGDTSFVTLFYPNTLTTSQHWCWSAAYTNTAVQDWLFAQGGE